MGLCGILACHFAPKQVLITDGDIATLQNMRQNVQNTVQTTGDVLVDVHVKCPQLIWGSSYAHKFNKQYSGPFDTIIASDIIYDSTMIQPIWETVSTLLSYQVNAGSSVEDEGMATNQSDGVFVLAYSKRNVPIEEVLDMATSFGFVWTMADMSANNAGDDVAAHRDPRQELADIYCFSRIEQLTM